MTTTDLSALSTSQLAEQVTAVQQELTRRQGQDNAARAEAFAAELAEVKAGTRRADPKHVAHLSPAETVEVINRGQLQHAGIAPDRRLRRGQ